MKNNKLVILLFVAVAIIQLAAPLFMAWHWEDVLQTGQRFYWQTAPVDPYDAFKGRYIDLRFKETSGPVLDKENLEYGQTAYAVIQANADGQATISGVSAKQPTAFPYVKVKMLYIENNTAHVELPFKRYYLPENMATAAESAYRESAGKTGIAAIRLKDGYGVIEQLYIDDKSLEDYLSENRR
ncbi:hypothetical protein SDC9_20831 [bioreactor metagenome]|uniref:GDYXXLXY protein n=1 Tax=bioreactor metagenome TaxID=1076179 RepID=A0A644U874_9ZZZZ|nr:GDYXXLXY domain-containing protein [Negativicutes bacterium]